jgi:hypothetical protein
MKHNLTRKLIKNVILPIIFMAGVSRISYAQVEPPSIVKAFKEGQRSISLYSDGSLKAKDGEKEFKISSLQDYAKLQKISGFDSNLLELRVIATTDGKQYLLPIGIFPSAIGAYSEAFFNACKITDNQCIEDGELSPLEIEAKYLTSYLRELEEEIERQDEIKDLKWRI